MKRRFVWALAVLLGSSVTFTIRYIQQHGGEPRHIVPTVQPKADAISTFMPSFEPVPVQPTNPDSIPVRPGYTFIPDPVPATAPTAAKAKPGLVLDLSCNLIGHAAKTYVIREVPPRGLGDENTVNGTRGAHIEREIIWWNDVAGAQWWTYTINRRTGDFTLLVTDPPHEVGRATYGKCVKASAQRF